MRRFNLILAGSGVPLLIVFLIARALPVLSAPAWQAQVDGWILETLQAEDEVEFLVYLEAQADLTGAAAIAGKEERGAYVWQRLVAVAERTQPALIAELDRLGASYRPYWIANMIWVRGDAATVERLARRGDVAHLYANPRVRLELPAVEREARAPQAVEPNISHINAPAVWAAGITGAGVVVGGQDTGYAWEHPALIGQYRGWDGNTASHDYNWHDAVHEDINPPAGNRCGFDSPVPCDDGSHGTHTMGTIAGDDGAANQIGVAPGAQWIGCRNMEQGWGTPATYSECFQWFVAPTDRQGENPRPELAPDAINNSWTCPHTEGCVDPLILQVVVANTRQAGIVVVSAAGNYGPDCSTVSHPPAIYDESFTVGATSLADSIATFSSRGPVTADSSNRLKPDVTAPGVTIRSSVPPYSYSYSNGTSMAAPHVTGLVALLLQARPELRGDVDAIELLIRESAVPLTTTQNCGGDGPDDVPNNVYGYGRIDALQTVQAAHRLLLSKVAEPSAVQRGDLLTYTLRVRDLHFSSPATGLMLTETLPADVTLVSTTMAHFQDGQTLTWSLPELAPGVTWDVSVVVAVSPAADGPLINDRYWVSSDQDGPRQGEPLVTPVVAHQRFLPLVMSRP
jgi:serine protease AprX